MQPCQYNQFIFRVKLSSTKFLYLFVFLFTISFFCVRKTHIWLCAGSLSVIVVIVRLSFLENIFIVRSKYSYSIVFLDSFVSLILFISYFLLCSHHGHFGCVANAHAKQRTEHRRGIVGTIYETRKIRNRHSLGRFVLLFSSHMALTC